MLRHLKLKKETTSFRIDDEKLLEKYKTVWTKIEDLKNIILNSLPVYDDRYIKTKIRTLDDRVCTNFRGLKVLEDDKEWQSFCVISIDSLLVYDKKYYLQVYLDNFAYKTVNKQMTDYRNEKLFEDHILQMLYYDRIDIGEGTDRAKSNNSK